MTDLSTNIHENPTHATAEGVAKNPFLANWHQHPAIQAHVSQEDGHLAALLTAPVGDYACGDILVLRQGWAQGDKTAFLPGIGVCKVIMVVRSL